MLPISRSEAKARGELRYYTGKLCRNGHLSDRMTSWGTCLACHCIREANRREKNVEQLAQWRAQSDIAARRRETTRLWREANAGTVDERRKQYQKKNRGQCNARTALYYVRKKKAVPAWVNKSALSAIYEACPIGYHVDHIVPLTHDLVCGLHVPWNLQYLTPAENSAKGNRQSWKELQVLAFTHEPRRLPCST